MRQATIVEIRPMVDRAEIEREWNSLCTTEQKSLAEFRVAKAKLLIQARSTFNSRGDGFVEYVETRLRVKFSTASSWMRDAGYEPPKKPGAGGDTVHARNEHDSTPDDSPDTEDDEDAVEAVEMTMNSARSAPTDWMSELERVGESMRTHARSLCSSAELLESLCRQHNASITSPAILSIHSKLVIAKTAIQQTIKIMKGYKGDEKNTLRKTS